MTSSSEIRKKFLDFFSSKKHQKILSASLIPENDPTTLFTSSGMQPLVPYLLGEEHPLGNRLVNSQRSFRAEDIEEVGDNRHTTYFEMLGNWSLGDYFKKEQLFWYFEFLADVVGLDPSRLFVTVFGGSKEVSRDSESAALWEQLYKTRGITSGIVDLTKDAPAQEIDFGKSRIFYYGTNKNWWSRSGPPDKMPAGEIGGPDSEVFYDFQTDHNTSFGKHCHPNCDCGRFMEIGNSVFIEYKKLGDGSFEKLPKRNVDFGGGLERIVAAKNNYADMFDIDLLRPIIDLIEHKTNKAYEKDESGKAFRVITDHVRAAAFLVADGALPSNVQQGYVVRRLLRRAIRYADTLGFPEGNFYELAGKALSLYNNVEGFSEISPNKIPEVERVIKKEEEKFRETLKRGLREFEKLSSHDISGKEAFVLFTTYGFPFELTLELADERGVGVDVDGFADEMKKHQELSRTASAGQFKGGLADSSEKVVRLHTATHLMNAALREVLGDHVWQKGSNINKDRTRFDFTHPQKMTDEEKARTEELVNVWIEKDYAVKKDMLSLAEAERLGAIGVFGEKYPDTVSIYSVYDPKTDEVVSREFCGGPHVEHTGVIGKFKIKKEESIGAGVRRIKAIIE